VTPDFERVIPALVHGDAKFIVIGVVAAIIHGSARATWDVDLLYLRDSSVLIFPR
jgi:hypothetical protein